MKNNVNKNGVRVLKTTKKDCFCHPEIPGFVIGNKFNLSKIVYIMI